MAEITEDDLIKQREKVDELRAKAAESATASEAREAALSREIQMAQLVKEQNKLEAVINLNTEAAKASNVDAGAADLLAAVKGEAPATPAEAPAEAPAKASKE